MYPVGFPGWKLAARAGMKVRLQVEVFHDVESNSYWAKSDGLDGLIVAGATLDELRHEVMTAANELLQLEIGPSRARASADMRFCESIPCAA